MFEVQKTHADRFVRRAQKRRKSKGVLLLVYLVLAQGLFGCTPSEDGFNCSPHSEKPRVCVDVSSTSPLVLNMPIVLVITVQSPDDVQGVAVSADIVPMNAQLGSLSKEPSWVVDLKGGVPEKLAFSVEVYQPGYYSVVGIVSVPNGAYDPIADAVDLGVGVVTPTP